MRTYQGRFRPKNPLKYKGDAKKIVYRSGWEMQTMRQLDGNPRVEWWCSEEVIIPYRSPIDGKAHRYFPDLLIKFKAGPTYLIEIKPSKETKPPRKKKNKRQFLNEVVTFTTNEAKWAAAEEVCLDRQWTFQIWTEKELRKLIPGFIG